MRNRHQESEEHGELITQFNSLNTRYLSTMTSQLLRQAIRLRSQVISRCHSNIYQARALQTLFLRAIAKPCVVEEVHVAETENEAANEYLGVRYNATKIKKYSAEPEMNGQVLKRGDFWTALDAAKAYDKLVVAYCETDSPRNFK